EAGDALRCLQQFSEAPIVRLSEIQRQRAPAWRRVVAHFASGNAREGFDALRELGAVHEIATPGKLFRAAASEYVRNLQAGVPTLVLSPVWSEIHAFTREVRSQLR